jgi:hypothetical protein
MVTSAIDFLCACAILKRPYPTQSDQEKNCSVSRRPKIVFFFSSKKNCFFSFAKRGTDVYVGPLDLTKNYISNDFLSLKLGPRKLSKWGVCKHTPFLYLYVHNVHVNHRAT